MACGVAFEETALEAVVVFGFVLIQGFGFRYQVAIDTAAAAVVSIYIGSPSISGL